MDCSARGAHHVSKTVDDESAPSKSYAFHDQFKASRATHLLLQTANLSYFSRSKCPDARDCLLDLVVPVMIRLSPKINFTLSYIATPSEPDGGVECMHGPTECLGNILELCAIHEYPDPKVY